MSATLYGQELPRLNDDRLQLQLFAEDPDIVTPIGMAIDRDDQIFVIESHTHHPPSDYEGPPGDRIKVFVDRDNDGQADRITIFAEGIQQAMNLAFSPTGDLYVVCAREVLRLVDADNDGVCDRKDQVVKLETRERYAHNSLLGITFDRDGSMYIARGNTGSHAYRFVGKDATAVEGYGDGGNVVRCRADGTELEEFATGFWNPFSLRFDRNGRLLLVDNDPDARGPNRLVHVVRDGDYGYKSLYGGGGNHPFQGWDGTLPGTLPFVAGTGEAPCDLLDCRRAALPMDYRRSVLVTVWNENSITRFDLAQQGATLTANGQTPFMSGPQDFRPVAIRCDSRGNIFVTDWVLVNYPNHGRGRIWRISCDADTTIQPQPEFAPYLPDPTSTEPIASATGDALVESLRSGDAFIRQAARRRLSQPKMRGLRERLADHDDPAVRLGSLLASKQAQLDSPQTIRGFLSDSDEQVRRAALMWAGQSLRTELRPDLQQALRRGRVSGLLFETYLAAVENLDPAFVKAYRARDKSRAKELVRRLDPNIVVDVAKDERFSFDVRGMAIEHFSDLAVDRERDWLIEQLQAAADPLVLAVMDRLNTSARSGDLLELLANIALGTTRSSPVRCEALFALTAQPLSDPNRFLPLLQSQDRSIAVEAARTMRSWLDEKLAAECIEPIKRMELDDEVAERLSHALNLKGNRTKRPESLEDWQAVVGEGGISSRGRRVFFTSRVGCAKCHTVDGRGGVLGPDLSGVAQSKSRQQIIRSVLDPSAEFPPQYQAWIVITTDGRVHRGLQLDHKAGGAIILTCEDGENRYFKADEIDQYDVSPTSLMPTGLSETMSVGELQDLIAFLTSLKE